MSVLSIHNDPVVRGVLLSIFLVANSHLAHAGDSAVAPFAPAIGATIKWKNTDSDKIETQIITAVENFRIRDTWSDRKRTYFLLCQYCGGNDMKVDEVAYSKLWPLKVGNSVVVERSRPGRWWTNKITVIGIEKLTLAFGTVDTYRVVDESSAANYAWTGKREFWYAPSVGWVVKIKSTESGPGATDSSWEAIEVKKP